MAKRLRRSAVFEYFKIAEDGRHYICQCLVFGGDNGDEVKHCNAKLSALSGSNSFPMKGAPSRSSNLKRHLMRHHNEVLKVVNERDEQFKPKQTFISPNASIVANENEIIPEILKGLEEFHNTFPSSSNLDSSMVTETNKTENVESEKICVSMTADKLKCHIVELVAKNGVPVGLFSQATFFGLIGEMAQKVDVSLDRENIRKLVIEEADSQKKKLKLTLQGRFVFLRVDACSFHDENYFAINVRFINDENKVVTQTLTITNIEAGYTSEYLQQVIMHVLDEFGIRKEHVLCIVIDNVSNTVKDIELQNKNDEETDVQYQAYLDDVPDHCHESDDSINYHKTGSDTNPHSLDDFVLDATSRIYGIQHMYCCMHTLYLAVSSSLQERYAANLINRVRKVVSAARTPEVQKMLHRFAETGVLMDETSQWETTYLMIHRLLDLKPFLIDMSNPQLSLTEAQWQEVKELESVLHHPYTLMKRLRAEDLTPSLFLMEWKNLIFRLTKIGGILAEGLLNSMKSREFRISNNKIMLAAVYVDPMYRVLLEDEQLSKAKAALYDISIRMIGIQETTREEKPIPSFLSNFSTDEDDFDKYLDQQENANKRRRLEVPLSATTTPVEATLTKLTEEFYHALKTVEKIDRSSKLKVEDAISVYPEIVRDAAHIVIALPTTRSNVDMLLSALRTIRYNVKAALKDDELNEAILFLKTNST